MITLLRKIFLSHWERKLISLFFAIVTWLIVNHSLTTTKTLDHISVRLINIPAGMTVEGLQPNGILTRKIQISLQGNKSQLDDITSNDIEVVLDAMDKTGEWLATISRKSLISLNPDIDLSKTVKRVVIQRLPVHFTRLVTEKIPIVVTHPVGEPPRDYDFLDIWPYHLNITVSGPEDVIKHCKAKGAILTFNLNDISRADLEAQESKSDEISFFVPSSWKQIEIPELSERPFEIDDPQAKELRIDFVRNDLHAIGPAIPISLFFPREHQLTINPEIYKLATHGIVQPFRGLNMLRKVLYARGVSKMFIELVEDMMELSILIAPKTEKKYLDWCIVFQNAKVLEDRYVSILMSEDQHTDIDPILQQRREEYLRNRFRSYMNRFQLYASNHQKYEPKIELVDHEIVIHEDSFTETPK